MPTPCSHEGCAGMGHFEGDVCPGSDDEDEMQHCVHCGELIWEDKGLHCENCGAYWCQIGWQNTFIFPDCQNDTMEHESVCADCFISTSKWHCNDASCNCDQKLEKVQAEYQKFISGGILCGEVTLKKGTEELKICIYRWQDNSAGRLEILQTKRVFDFKTLDEAVIAAKAMISEMKDYTPSDGYGYLK